jgi:hypothetical protein
MEIKYQAPATQEKSVEMSETQLNNLKEIALVCLVDRMRVIGLSNPYASYEHDLIVICKELGVDFNSKLALTNFLSAALGVVPAQY